MSSTATSSKRALNAGGWTIHPESHATLTHWRQRSLRLLIVDPHLQPQESRFRLPIRALLNAAQRSDGSLPCRFELLCSAPGETEKSLYWLANQFEPAFADRLRPGAELRVRLLTQRVGGQKFHERYFLTNRGGIKLDPGFDQGKEGETYELVRLPDDHYRLLWAAYCSDSLAFDVAHELTLVGSEH